MFLFHSLQQATRHSSSTIASSLRDTLIWREPGKRPSWNYRKTYTIATSSTTPPVTRATRASIVMSQQHSDTRKRASCGSRSPASIGSVLCVTWRSNVNATRHHATGRIVVVAESYIASFSTKIVQHCRIWLRQLQLQPRPCKWLRPANPMSRFRCHPLSLTTV